MYVVRMYYITPMKNKPDKSSCKNLKLLLCII